MRAGVCRPCRAACHPSHSSKSDACCTLPPFAGPCPNPRESRFSSQFCFPIKSLLRSNRLPPLSWKTIGQFPQNCLGLSHRTQAQFLRRSYNKSERASGTWPSLRCPRFACARSNPNAPHFWVCGQRRPSQSNHSQIHLPNTCAAAMIYQLLCRPKAISRRNSSCFRSVLWLRLNCVPKHSEAILGDYFDWRPLVLNLILLSVCLCCLVFENLLWIHLLPKWLGSPTHFCFLSRNTRDSFLFKRRLEIDRCFVLFFLCYRPFRRVCILFEIVFIIIKYF